MLSSQSSSPKLDELEKERDFTDVYIHKANDDIYEDGTLDPVYQAKARVLNAAIQEIGMGKYQVRRLWFRANCEELKADERRDLVVPLHRRWIRLVRVSNRLRTPRRSGC